MYQFSCLLLTIAGSHDIYTFCYHHKLLSFMGILYYVRNNIDALVEGCSISSALAMEILQSCSKPSIYRNLLQCH